MNVTRPTASFLAVALGAAGLCAADAFAAAPDTLEEIVVTSQRREQSRLDYAGNIETLDADTIGRVRHQHIHELLTRVAGVWVDRVSGQEHLTAIRSPVLTGAGSCGGFLFLEDGIPIRPAGFCNVNQFFEIVTEQASSIEVIRGPGDAVYGSNALHGIVNTLLPQPGEVGTPAAALEFGANDYVRVRSQFPFHDGAPWLAALVFADDGGFRDQSGYRQGKLHLKRAWSLAASDFVLALSATDLDQDTAGSIRGENAYRDPDVNRSNPNPEAFRRARSQRLYGRWTGKLNRFDFDLRPYIRHTDMEFLQHFLPGQPLEENGHVSAGTMASFAVGSERRRFIFGFDVDWSDIYLEEFQEGPAEGSAFLVATRPAGQHYDYDVTATNAAAFLQADLDAGERLTISLGGRLETMRYDYRNRMLDGNTRDDGTECGFGGCLYTRPADRDDRFTDFAPKLAIRYALGERSSVYAKLARGFRAPQATELYRLQSGQTVADLDSERIDSIEFGLASTGDVVAADIAVFAMRKRDSIFRDSEGFNVSGARTRHQGVEAALDWQLDPRWQLQVDVSYARHEYDVDIVAAGGQAIVSGRDVDTAPRWLGSVELLYEGAGRIDGALQLTRLGAYYLEPGNAFDYPGHTLANLRLGITLGDRANLVLRLNNVADREIADRADYAFGSYRYWPGRGREFFAEIQYSPRSESP